jgi:peptide/nickel transport system substrate-binding protein
MKRCIVALAAALAWLTSAPASSAEKVLRFIPQADLRILDPIVTTAGVTRNHAYMIYDTLFATDASGQIRPQMVDRWSVSKDKLTYTFTLREGLAFHDGQPVRPADCIASLERWAQRDVLGQRLALAGPTWIAVDEKTFRLQLKRPFPRTLEALGELSSNVPFIMPERIAKTDAYKAITETIGSGPFKFVKEEWVPGSKVVYVRNPRYVPRGEPASWAAGGKRVNVDRVEWLYIPDPATAAAAINANEADWWEVVPPDMMPLLERNRDVRVAHKDEIGSVAVMRFNTLQPPFDNVRLRQALLYAIDQKDYVLAVAGGTKLGRECFSFYTCGTPLSATPPGMPLATRRDLERARRLIREAGYRDQRIVLISASDQPQIHSQALITYDLLRKLGMNVELQVSDWGTLLARRASKEPVEKNGWSIFHTLFMGPDLATPAGAPLAASGDKAWFGWPSDPALERLRDQWFDAADAATSRRLADAIQRQALQSVPFIPTSQVIMLMAHRTSLTSVIVSPITFFWSVMKK